MLYDDSIPDSTLLTLHPELEPIFRKYGPPRLPLPSRENIAKFRKGFAVNNRKFNTSPLARNVLGCSDPEDPQTRYWSEHDVQIPVRDGTAQITLRIHKPKSIPESGVPVVVLMHGGGWIMGDVNTEALLARLFVVKLGVLVVNVGFRNYPDVKFGVPVLDCYDAVKWTARNAKPLGGNCDVGFVLAGVSGGGDYAAICAHFARDEGLSPRPTGQWLSCPVLPAMVVDEKTKEKKYLFDLETVNRSAVQNRDAPLMNEAMRDAIGALAGYPFASKLLTPFLFDSHKDLGSGGVYVQVAGLDPWRDSGRIYQGLCAREGSRVKMEVYSGLPHCWWTSFAMLKVTTKWTEDCVKGMLWLLTEKDEGDGKATSKL